MGALSSIEELLFGLKQTFDATTDHRLLEASRAGDEAAFAELVQRYRHPITNYIYRLTNDYDLAVDLAQETFLRVYGALARYHTNFAFSTYIYRIATNLAISELRRRKRRRFIPLTAFFQPNGDNGDGADFDLTDDRPLPDAKLVASERQRAIARAIASLPEKYRVPLILRDIEERNYEEIAQILHLSEGTVKSRISRARALLREKLRNYL